MASEETSFRCIHIKITSTSGKKKVTTYSNCITVLGLNSTDCNAISQPTTDWMSLVGSGKASSLHTYLIELN